MTNNIIKDAHFKSLLEGRVVKKFDESETREYFVSIYGNFYSRLKSSGKVIQIKLAPDGQGYLRANVKGKTTKVHIVVAETFIRPRKKGEVINHRNSDRECNELWNIEIVSQSENVKHAWDMKRRKVAGRGNRTLTMEQAQIIRDLHREGHSFNGLAKRFNCTTTSVKQIVENRTYIFNQEDKKA